MKHKAAILPGSRIIWLQSQYAVTADQSIFIAFQHIQRVASCAPDARPVIFFFSSRRRHTRSLRDWSSDVCSSDLGDPRRTRTILSCCPATFALGSGSALAALACPGHEILQPKKRKKRSAACAALACDPLRIDQKSMPPPGMPPPAGIAGLSLG